MSIEIKHKVTGEVIHTVGADTLAGAYLSGADLSGSDLSWADLSGANLIGASLGGAKFTADQMVTLLSTLGICIIQTQEN